MGFLESLRQSRLLAILRGINHNELPLVSEACKRARIGFVEITLNTSDALAKITSLARLSEGSFQVGAGTVLTAREARDAVAAGAQFLVSPILEPHVAEVTRELDIPYIPGALTPQEVWNAAQAGAAVVKVFPISCYGPNYIQELRGPFGNTPLLGCGGIRKENLRNYLEAGADALALGASTFRREWLDQGNLTALIQALDELVATVRAFHEKCSATGCR